MKRRRKSSRRKARHVRRSAPVASPKHTRRKRRRSIRTFQEAPPMARRRRRRSSRRRSVSSAHSACPRAHKRRGGSRRRSGGMLGGSMGGLGKFMPPAAILSTVGAFGSLFAIDKVFGFLTTKNGVTTVPEWLTSNYARAGVKVAVGAAGYTLLKKYNSAAAGGFFIGCGLAACMDLYNQFSPPASGTSPAHTVHGFAALNAGPGQGYAVSSPGPDYGSNDQFDPATGQLYSVPGQ